MIESINFRMTQHDNGRSGVMTIYMPELNQKLITKRIPPPLAKFFLPFNPIIKKKEGIK